ncbi:GNAT family N-acetyltransferase [Enterovibrio norvegicus]|uniref:GNAT family N-acetyltransferase n=1 Tax=Enterovibrio norvegicus TaxID=188144 RepID=UPI000C827C0A|nr:GNAT family N-acetyltransferase [Enterovibrio norvegicus]PMN68348.1 hypothetical protein BCT27_24210 [Enterovibrio norvegicus]
MKITTTNRPDESADEIIDKGLDRHAENFVTENGECLSVYCHDKEGNFIGGLLGETCGNWFHIWQFWVTQSHRGASLGTNILDAAEKEAIKRGCKASHVDTFSFQAPEFYLKRGYHQFGLLEEYGGKFSRVFLKKQL